MSTWAITRRMPQVCRGGRSESAHAQGFLIYPRGSMSETAVGAIVAAVIAVTALALMLRVRASETRARRHGEALEAAERVARLGSFRLDLATRETTWSDELYRLQGPDPGDGAPSYQ